MRRYKNTLTFIGTIDELPKATQKWIPDGSIFIEEIIDTSGTTTYREYCKLNDKWEITQSGTNSGLPTDGHIHKISDILNLESTIIQLNSTIQNKIDIPSQPEWDNFILTLQY